MKKMITLLMLLPVMAMAQQTQPKEQHVKAGFGVTLAQEQPEFPGGPAQLTAFLKKNLNYPLEAKINRVQGRVYLGFLVEKTGAVADLRIISGIDPLLDNEALRVARLMPAWKPGRIGNEPAAMHFVLPVDFILPKEDRPVE